MAYPTFDPPAFVFVVSQRGGAAGSGSGWMGSARNGVIQLLFIVCHCVW